MLVFDATDIVGDAFGHLQVEKVLGRQRLRTRNSGHGRYVWRYECRCSCGTLVELARSNIITGHTKSCGCLKRRRGSSNPGWKGHGKISGYQWARIRRHAKDRGIPFNITKQQAWDHFEAQGGRCSLTGWPLVVGLSSKRKSNQTASLDRIDSHKGYTPDNIQWVHKDVNQMKWDLTSERFFEVCKAVVENRRASCQ